jgi:hypothetical protein
MGALDRDALGWPGNGLAALAAKNVFLFFGFLFRGFFFGELRRTATVFFGGTFPQQRYLIAFYDFHFTGSSVRHLLFSNRPKRAWARTI